MTKTTTTCHECGAEIWGLLFLRLTAPATDGSGNVKFSAHPDSPLKEGLDFCSRSCLSEYLKPKTETTP